MFNKKNIAAKEAPSRRQTNSFVFPKKTQNAKAYKKKTPLANTMAPNVCSSERALRVVCGLILFILAMYKVPGMLFTKGVLYFFSFLLLITGISGYCPLYSLSSFSTSSRRQSSSIVSQEDLDKTLRDHSMPTYTSLEKIKAVHTSTLRKEAEEEEKRKAKEKAAKTTPKKKATKKSTTKKTPKKTTKKQS